jgi:protein-S-isoprenylcysteine O-methyltransferase Ste14
MVLRHLLSVLLLPFVVAVVLPYALIDGTGGHSELNLDSPWTVLRIVAGAALLLAGLVLFVWSVGLFAIIGRGTLAPWDPTRNLVTVGPYRYVRNPMISGVALILLGEALIWGSTRVGAWLAAFLLINHAYFLLLEEPGLEQRFGEAFEFTRPMSRDGSRARDRGRADEPTSERSQDERRNRSLSTRAFQAVR